MERKILWKVNSRYAEVTCYDGIPPIVEKVICPGKVNLDNVEWVNEFSRIFREKLRSVGVPLAEPYTFETRGSDAVQTSPYVGRDLEFIFQKDGGSLKLIESIIGSIAGLLLQKTPTVGLDARLSNFAGGREAIYIDTFPPILRHEGELIVHFPNPKDSEILKQEVFRKMSPLGILRRMRFSILEQDVNVGEEELLQAIYSVLGQDFYIFVKEYFDTLPDKFNLSDSLEKLTLTDPDGIREVAVKFMPPHGDNRDIFLREIFNLSSNYCPYDLSPEQRIGKIREMLFLYK